MRKLRLALAVIVLVLSLTLLLWGILPSARERRSLKVSPTEMTLPTPSSYLPEPEKVPELGLLFAGLWAV